MFNGQHAMNVCTFGSAGTFIVPGVFRSHNSENHNV